MPPVKNIIKIYALNTKRFMTQDTSLAMNWGGGGEINYGQIRKGLMGFKNAYFPLEQAL